MTQESLPNPSAQAATLSGVATLFLRLGLTAFGGPAAHIAMMQQEIVERRGWMSGEQFLDLLGAANLIPGPSSTELAILIGYRLVGPLGLLLAGVCFILPAFVLVLAIACAYVRFGSLPQVGRALYGVKPVVVAIVAQALWNLGRTAIKSRLLACLGLLALAPAYLGASPLLILLGAGLFTGGVRWSEQRTASNLKPLVLLVSVLATFAAAPLLFRGALAPSPHFGLFSLFWVFLKIGSVIYGSGYVLLAFLRSDLVLQRGWLNYTQLLDAVAVGQVTPGPVFTTATFIGFILGGTTGAIVATVAIFLPAFLFVAITGPFASRLRNSPLTGAFLDGVNVASLALMASVTWQLGRAAVIDPITIVLAAASLLALVHYRINSTWLIACGILIGITSGLVGHGLR